METVLFQKKGNNWAQLRRFLGLAVVILQRPAERLSSSFGKDGDGGSAQ